MNCAALVEILLEVELFGIEDRTATGVRGRRGKFELADGGTLFLDEVSDLSPAAQASFFALSKKCRSSELVATPRVLLTHDSLWPRIRASVGSWLLVGFEQTCITGLAVLRSACRR